MRITAWTAATLLLAICLTARAETIQWVNAQRIHFSDAVPNASGALASVDLGPAPPPGSSRLFSKDELRTFAVLAHESIESLHIPRDVRVKRATRLMSEHELDALIRPTLMAARIEVDFIGERLVPKEALWGIHTSRAIENFPSRGVLCAASWCTHMAWSSSHARE